MTFDEARQRLDTEGQGHVLRFWERLNGDERGLLLEQIASLDLDRVRQMRVQLRGRQAGAGGPAS
ncbi:MAG: hypothetical protein GX571_08485, partial [Lentisphaerae bacterium]|nr:hypothetical protein [Lentisphaerota bacterium]